jgi:hypothetical protein
LSSNLFTTPLHERGVSASLGGRRNHSRFHDREKQREAGGAGVRLIAASHLGSTDSVHPPCSSLWVGAYHHCNSSRTASVQNLRATCHGESCLIAHVHIAPSRARESTLRWSITRNGWPGLRKSPILQTVSCVPRRLSRLTPNAPEHEPTKHPALQHFSTTPKTSQHHSLPSRPFPLIPKSPTTQAIPTTTPQNTSGTLAQVVQY